MLFTRILEIDKSQLPPRPRHHLHQALRADPTDGFGIEFGFLVHLRGDQPPVLPVLIGVFFDEVIIRRQLPAQIDPAGNPWL